VFLGPQSWPQLSIKESKSKANYVFYLTFEAPFGPRSTFTAHMSDCFQTISLIEAFPRLADAALTFGESFQTALPL